MCISSINEKTRKEEGKGVLQMMSLGVFVQHVVTGTPLLLLPSEIYQTNDCFMVNSNL